MDKTEKLDPLPTIEDEVKTLVKIVARESHVAAPLILGRGRQWEVATARQCLYCILYNQGWTLTQIGRALGRDHGAVHHGVRSLNARYQQKGQRITTRLMDRLAHLDISPILDEAASTR